MQPLLGHVSAAYLQPWSSLWPFKIQISVFFVFVGSGCVVALDTRVNLPPKDTRISSFNAQPRAEGLKAGVFQQFHRCDKATGNLGQSHFLQVQSITLNSKLAEAPETINSNFGRKFYYSIIAVLFYLNFHIQQ